MRWNVLIMFFLKRCHDIWKISLKLSYIIASCLNDDKIFYIIVVATVGPTKDCKCEEDDVFGSITRPNGGTVRGECTTSK